MPVNIERATASCFCGSVRPEIPAEGDKLLGTFVCHCGDCRKITASMFASGLIVTDTALAHLKGEENLTAFTRHEGIATGNTVSNHFCCVCGTLMHRRRFPGMSVLRIGTVDDLELQST
ncbi:hypothetical protein B0A55_01203 [Friedmanniomyces simplex]|uniref:CENP-V/GFA domain-containing protein n=1 Tax=Friedmanniomyces simplex TaxID=329884 RepID=A0A4U0Y1I6_9PEZI|nr:hypothetical protein B0A55_01203 [Friedmanniomyces simplex]